MLFFAHAGIGTSLAAPLVTANRRRALLLGTLLPDLVDKPLYYGMVWATGRHGAELGLISGSRTVGHTLLAMVTLAAAGRLLRRPALVAVALGMVTHLLLDGAGDLLGLLGPHRPRVGPSILAAIFFPLFGPHFPVLPFHDAAEHLGSLVVRPELIVAELIGAALLIVHLRRTTCRSPEQG